jgi:hypothetical protein
LALLILRDPALDAYGNVAKQLDWSAAEQEVAQVRRLVPEDAFIAVSESVVNSGPVLEFLVDRPSMHLPNAAFVEAARRRPVVYLYQPARADQVSAAVLAAGATELGRTTSFVLLTFPSLEAVPPQVDPDG